MRNIRRCIPLLILSHCILSFVSVCLAQPAWFDHVQLFQALNGLYISPNPNNETIPYSGMAWGFLPCAVPPDSELKELAAWKSRGSFYVAAANLTAYWGDCSNLFPIPDSARWVDIGGAPINTGGFGLPELPQYSLSNQQWRDFLKTMVQHAIDIGAAGIQLDNATAGTNNIAFGGEHAGSFDTFTMAAFRAYLTNKFSAADLKSRFGLDNMADFDYGTWIKQQGREKTWNQLPLNGLAAEFYLFRSLEEKSLVNELTIFAHQYAHDQYGRTFTISTNANFGVASHELLNEVDYFLNEHYPFSTFSGNSSPFANVDIKSYKGVQRWPVVITPEPLYAQGLPTSTVNMIRLVLADIYATGGTIAFSGAFNDWTVTNKIAIDPGVLRKYAQFILANEAFFENLHFSPQVAILDSTASRRARLIALGSIPGFVPSTADESHYYGTARLLVDNNIQYDSILAPDGVISTMPSFTLEQLQKYKVLVLPNVLVMDDSQASTILEYVRSGGIVIATGLVATYQPNGMTADRPEFTFLQQTDGAMRFGNGVFVHTASNLGTDYQTQVNTEMSKICQRFRDLILPYITPEIITGPVSEVYRAGGATAFLSNDQAGNTIVQIVNYDYDEFTDQFDVKSNVPLQVRIGSQPVNDVVLRSPDFNGAQSLPFTRNGDTITVTVPSLEAWAVLYFQQNEFAPIIQSSSPQGSLNVIGGSIVDFGVQAIDPDGNPLTYTWTLNGLVAGDVYGPHFSVQLPLSAEGNYSIVVSVSDGAHVTQNSWILAARPYQPPRVMFDETHAERNTLDPTRAEQIEPDHPDWVLFSLLKQAMDPNFQVNDLLSGSLSQEVLSEADVLVLAAPGQALTDIENQAVADFVHNGGGLIFLGDAELNPVINTLLGRFGIQLNNVPILSPQDSSHPENFNVSVFPSHPATGQNPRYWANYSGSFVISSPAISLAQTTTAEWRSLSFSNTKQPGDPSGPFVIVAAAKVGKGRIFAVSDNAFHDAAIQPFPQNKDLFLSGLSWVSGYVNDRTASMSLFLSDGGADTASTLEGEPIQTGYATANVHSGNTPYGTAVFSFKENGVTVTEAGVPASPPTTSARLFIDYRSAVNAIPGRSDAGTIGINTGIALVSYGSATANVTYTLRDLAGATLSIGHGTIAAGNHLACFIDQLQNVAAPDFNFPSDFQSTTQFGSLEINSDQPLSVLALRGTNNQRNDFLITTTPVADLTQSLINASIFFPQFVDGGGYTTSLILLNTSGITETGSFQIMDANGDPLTVNPVGGTSNSSFNYLIPAYGVFHFQTDGFPTDAKAGWVRLTPNGGSYTPVGSGVFGYTPADVLVSESGIPSAIATTHARVYVDLSANHNTGLAIANVTDTEASITMNAFQMDGSTAAGTSQGPLPLSPNGYSAAFADQFITGLPDGFTGVLDISSSTPFAALTLRSLVNERNDFLMTTFPIADENQPAPSPIVFPQIVDGGGYVTQFILISAGGAASTTLSFYDEKGMPTDFGD